MGKKVKLVYRTKIIDVLRAYFRRYEMRDPRANRATNIQTFLKNNMRNSSGRPAKYVMSPAELGQVLKALRFIRTARGVWHPPPGFMEAAAEA